MTMLSSLRSRMFLSSALLTVLSIGVAVLLVSVRVTREAENATEREIRATGAVVEQLRTTRTQTFTSMARLIADTPTLKAAVDTNDPPTVQNVVNGYQAELGPNLLLVTNETGVVLAAVGLDPGARRLASIQPAVGEALAGREGFSLLPQSDGMLQLVTVPILIGRTRPEILGTLSVGFLFDEALGRQLKEITGSEIAFGLDGEILATTLPRERRPALRDLLRQASGPAPGMLETGEYVALALPLSTVDDTPGADSPVALILHSRTEQLRLVRTLRTELALIAALAVLLATLLSFAVARTITRPLAAVTGAMREVAATGDLTRKIELRDTGRWEDADARLLATTFNTLTQSIARFQREYSQRERLSSLGRLSTVIAHEVRNPLMIIKAALHSLRAPEVSRATITEAVSDVDGEVARLNRIVNDVLDFARPIPFELAPADLNALCRASAAAAQASPGAAVYLDLDPTVPPIVTDAERLRLALVNLVENARLAVDPALSAPAGVAAGAVTSSPGDAGGQAVRLATRAHGDRATILIADTGVGINAADLSRVFDPYFTTRRGGTGLGLPIAKNIVEGLGGTIAISTATGAGTTIRIDLPLTTELH